MGIKCNVTSIEKIKDGDVRVGLVINEYYPLRHKDQTVKKKDLAVWNSKNESEDLKLEDYQLDQLIFDQRSSFFSVIVQEDVACLLKPGDDADFELKGMHPSKGKSSKGGEALYINARGYFNLTSWQVARLAQSAPSVGSSRPERKTATRSASRVKPEEAPIPAPPADETAKPVF